MNDFFISYNSADRQWAEWIAWQLEEAGYTTVLQAFPVRASFAVGDESNCTQFWLSQQPLWKRGNVCPMICRL